MVLISLQVSDDLAQRRREQRRYCEQCYPLPAIEAARNSCIRCGDTLAYRSDDELTKFTERLALRRMHTDQMVSLARRLGILVVELDATLAPMELTQQLLECLQLGGPSAA